MPSLQAQVILRILLLCNFLRVLKRSMPFNVHFLVRFPESESHSPFLQSQWLDTAKQVPSWFDFFLTIAKHWCFSPCFFGQPDSLSNTFLARQEINVRMQKAIAKLMGLAPMAQWRRLCLYHLAVMVSQLNVLAIERSQEVAQLPSQNETSS